MASYRNDYTCNGWSKYPNYWDLFNFCSTKFWITHIQFMDGRTHIMISQNKADRKHHSSHFSIILLIKPANGKDIGFFTYTYFSHFRTIMWPLVPYTIYTCICISYWFLINSKNVIKSVLSTFMVGLLLWHLKYSFICQFMSCLKMCTGEDI